MYSWVRGLAELMAVEHSSAFVLRCLESPFLGMLACDDYLRDTLVTEHSNTPRPVVVQYINVVYMFFDVPNMDQLAIITLIRHRVLPWTLIVTCLTYFAFMYEGQGGKRTANKIALSDETKGPGVCLRGEACVLNSSR